MHKHRERVLMRDAFFAEDKDAMVPVVFAADH
jgi:hypothetical protein